MQPSFSENKGIKIKNGQIKRRYQNEKYVCDKYPILKF